MREKGMRIFTQLHAVASFPDLLDIFIHRDKNQSRIKEMFLVGWKCLILIFFNVFVRCRAFSKRGGGETIPYGGFLPLPSGSIPLPVIQKEGGKFPWWDVLYISEDFTNEICY